MNKNKLHVWIAGGLVGLTLLFAALIVFIPERNNFFMALLCLNLVCFVIYRHRFTNSMLVFCRTLVGLLFIFSSLTKGIDPLGTQYQMLDYMSVYHADWAHPFALLGSFLLNALEFSIGILLLFNIWSKFTAWLLAGFMLWMTFVTTGDAFYNTVPDCGCFGKALKISNWQTFYKNLVIDAFVLLIFFARGRMRCRCKFAQWVVVLAFLCAFFGFEMYNYRHLPMIDFMDWKVGKRIYPENPLPIKHYATYKNNQTGEQKEFLSKDIPFSDPTFVENWVWVDSRVEDPNPPSINIALFDEEQQTDITDVVLKNPDHHFFVVAYDLKEGHKKGWLRAAEFLKEMEAKGYACAVFTATEDSTEIAAFKHEKGLENIPFYHAGDTDLKMIVRDNPGLVWMHDATIMDKWAWRDIPGDEWVKNFK